MTDIISDTFTGANGTSLTVHAPDVNTPGNSWVNGVGTWTIQTNKAGNTAGVNNQSALIDANCADCDVSADVTLVAGSTRLGVIGRWIDASNFWQLILTVAGAQIQLIERNAATNTVRASAAITVADGETHNVKLSLSGTTLTGTMDGANTVSYTSSSFQTSTTHGIHATNMLTTERHDNFRVEITSAFVAKGRRSLQGKVGQREASNAAY